MRKIFFALILGTAFSATAFSQNMIIIGADYNLSGVDFWGVGVGFNHVVFNRYFQNDFMLNFGAVRAKSPDTSAPSMDENGEPALDPSIHYRFMFSIMDRLYFALDGRRVGLRVGVFAALGMYAMPSFPPGYGLFFNTGGFVGINILPRSPVSVTIDLGPGYAVAFRISDGLTAHDSGFSLPLFLGLRFNFDRL